MKRPLTSRFVLYFALLSAALLVMAGAITYLASVGLAFLLLLFRAITRPLRRMQEAVQRFTTGGSDEPLPETSHDKVVQLARECNRMAAGILERTGGLGALPSENAARKRTEAALFESREMLRQVLDTIPVRVFWKDRNLEYLGCNRSFAHDAGVPDVGALVGKDDRAMGWADQAEAYRADDRRVMQTGQSRLNYEEPQTTPDGGRIWLRTSKVPLRDALGNCTGVLGTYEDITAYKEADEKLRASEAFVRSVIESIAEGFYAVDPHGNCTLVNRACLQMTGFDRQEEMVGRHIHELIHHTRADGTPYPATECRMYKALRDHVGIHVDDEVFWRRDGTSFPVEYWSHPIFRDGQLVGAVASFFDITERKRAEQALRDSEARMRAITDSAQDAILMMDPAGRVTYWNPAAERMLGYRPDEALGQNLHELIVPARYLAAHCAALPSFVQTGKGAVVGKTVEFEARRKDGQEIAVQISLSAVHLGGAWHAVGIIRDITARKLAEVELARAHQELLKISHAAGMAEVATGVLHNVGNVLNSVNVSAALIADHTRHSKWANIAKLAAMFEEHQADLASFLTTDPRGRMIPGYLGSLAGSMAQEQNEIAREVADLRKNIEHINDIVAVQQNYAQTSGLIETAPLAELVEDALRMNASLLAQHHVEVVRDFRIRPTLTTDRHKIVQILINLVRNAQVACDGSDRPDKRIAVRLTGNEQQVSIAVSDNGVGITPDNLTQVFNHGFTTRKDGHGFGLHSGALAAKQLGGRLTVQSGGVGQGATFTLELPLQHNPESR